MTHIISYNFLLIFDFLNRMQIRLKKFRILGYTGVLVLCIGALSLWIYTHSDQKTMASPFEKEETTLPDVVLGATHAPHEVVMYFALDCAHCRQFEQRVLPEIRKKFIDTGEVRFILRDFPLGPAGLLASKIAWIRGEEHYLSTISLLLDQQDVWNVPNGYTTQLKKIALEIGLTDRQFDRCLNDRDLEDDILLRRMRAQEKDKIDAVPTFIVDGKQIEEILSVKLLKKLIKKKEK